MVSFIATQKFKPLPPLVVGRHLWMIPCQPNVQNQVQNFDYKIHYLARQKYEKHKSNNFKHTALQQNVAV